jgi:hypothetical protein
MRQRNWKRSSLQTQSYKYLNSWEVEKFTHYKKQNTKVHQMIKLQWKLNYYKRESKEVVGIKREGREGDQEEQRENGEERHLQKNHLCETGQSEDKKYTVIQYCYLYSLGHLP